MAFNLTVLSNLLGTPLEPDFTGVDLMIEDVSEQLYRIDRTMFHVTAAPNVRRAARLRLGRVTDILANDPEFGPRRSRHRRGLVRAARASLMAAAADIGHDAANKVVPFAVPETLICVVWAIAKAAQLRSTKRRTTGGP